MKQFGAPESFIGLSIVLAVSALAEPSAYEENGRLIIDTPSGIRSIFLPDELKRGGNYSVEVPPRHEKPLGREGNVPGMSQTRPFRGRQSQNVFSPNSKHSLKSLLIRANKYFYQKKYSRALETLDQAEAIAPENDRVKTMMGSLLYQMGWTGEARKYWEESLSINPNQTDVKSFLQKTKAEAAPAEENTNPFRREVNP